MTLIKKLKLKVNGIHCNGCATKIKNSIAELKSNDQTNVDISNGLVEVSFESEKTTTSQIKEKIENVGFSIESLEIG